MWYHKTKECPNDLPTDTIEWLRYIQKRNTNKLTEWDMLTILELRHIGLYSSYKNINKITDINYRKEVAPILKQELIKTTQYINKITNK